MAAGDEKQDEIEQLLARRDNSAASKTPGAFTRFFQLETAQPQTPAGTPDLESGRFNSYSPSPAAPGNLNADAPPMDPAAGAEQAHPGMQSGIPPAHPGTWNDASVHSLDQPNRQPGSFTSFFHNEVGFAQPSTSGFNQSLGSPSLISPPAADPFASVSPHSTSEYLEKANDAFGTGPAFAEAHPVRDSQKATHLFSQPRPIAEPAMPLAGPSPFTRVINSSAQRADEEKTGSSAPPASNAPPQAAAPAGAPAPFAAPQWPVASVPNPQMYASPYLQQPPIPMAAAPPVPWPQAPAPPAVAAPSVPQPPPQSGGPTPQPAWVAYTPLIIGASVLLFLTSIFILIFALAK